MSGSGHSLPRKSAACLSSRGKSASRVIWHGSCCEHDAFKGRSAMSTLETVAFAFIAGLSGLLTLATAAPIA